MDSEQPLTSTVEPKSLLSAWASPSRWQSRSEDASQEECGLVSAFRVATNSPSMDTELPARTLHIRVDLDESSPSTEMIGLGSACPTPKNLENAEQEFQSIDGVVQPEVACDEFLREIHSGSRDEQTRTDEARIVGTEPPGAYDVMHPIQDARLDLQSVPQQLALFVEERVDRLSASIHSALEQQAAHVNCELERAKEQWACSLKGERSQRYEGLNALHLELKQYQTVFSELQPVLRSQLEHHDRAITELSPRVRKCIDDGLLALHKSVELHDCTIAEMSPRLKRRIDDGLKSLRNEIEQLRSIVLQLTHQVPSGGDIRPESVDKIFEMIGAETRTQVKTLQVIVEKRIAHIMTLEIAMEKKVAERYNVLEKSLTEMGKRVEQTERYCQRIEDELREELLSTRREFHEHRLINERVEALAATSVTALQRELQKHQEMLASLADSIKHVEVKCEAFDHRGLAGSPLSNSYAINSELAAVREQLSSHVESEIQRLQQSQQGQQNLLDDLLSRAQRLQEKLSGLFSQCVSKWNQEEFCSALEKSQEQLSSLQQMLEKSLHLMQQPEFSLAQQALSETPQVCSLEAALADIRGRLFAQQCAQEDLQREVCSIRGSSCDEHIPPPPAMPPNVVALSQTIRHGSRVEVRCQDAWYKATVLKLPHEDVDNQGRYSVQCDADGGSQIIRSRSVRLSDQDNSCVSFNHLEDKVERMAAQLSRLERRFPDRYSAVLGSQRISESQ